MNVQVARPKTRAGQLALIKQRRKHVAQLEDLLTRSMPAQDRRHLQQRLRGERASLASWETWVARKTA